MNEKRHYKRSSLTGDGNIIDFENDRNYIVHLLDLSASGAKVFSDTELQESRLYKINLKPEGHMAEVAFTADIRIVWKREVYKGFEYGLKFVKISHKDRVELDELIRHSNTAGVHLDLPYCEDGSCTFFVNRKRAGRAQV